MQQTFNITGLTQWSSAEALASRLSELPEVQDVHMDIVAGTARITSRSLLPMETVRSVVVEAGHSLAPHTASTRGPGLFIGGLAIALIAGFSLGKLITPAAVAAPPTVTPSAHHAGGANTDGLAISSSGYTLVPTGNRFAGPSAYPLSFVVKDAKGVAVTRFATVHEKQLHLVVVRRDLTGYQHLHPVMAADGTWTVTATLDASGPWRVYADFSTINASFSQVPVTLGYDLHVGGDFQPRTLPQQSNVVSRESQPGVLLFSVPGAKLQPYLGSYGHLVVLREGDMAHIHAHPEPQLVDGKVKFWLTLPSSGTYRLFFDYQADGQVQTYAFDQIV